MVAILTDNTYSDSLWSQSLYQSLTERLRLKRIPFCVITDECPAQCDTVFVITSDYEWTRNAVRQLNKSGRSPILLCNQYENLPSCVYSCVCSDINASMKNLLETLHLEEKRRIAVFGMNPSSISDISRVNSIFTWKAEDMETIPVFLNEGSLENCFDAFYEQAERFDAVICTNDFAAIYLVRTLLARAPERLRNLRIVSCAESKLSDYYRRYITTLKVNFDQYGRAAVYIYEALEKHSYLSGMTVHVAWSFREDAQPQQLEDTPLEVNRKADNFYQDPNLREMLIADKILSSADPTDRRILSGLAAGQSYDEIAEQCFLSEGGIKYRIKRMIGQSGAASREEALSILYRYTREIP